jgi:hypothetical protein
MNVSTAAQGDRVVRAYAVDAAGNESLDSPPLTVTRDTQDPPAPTVDLHQDDDSGSSHVDNLTNADSWRISGSHGAGTSTISVRLDGSEAAATSVAPAAPGSYGVTLDVSARADGACQVQAVAVDLAGNESDPGTLTVTRDTETAPPSTPDLAPGSDTGRSDTDNITRSGSRTFTGAAEIGATVEILVGGTPAGSGTAGAGGSYSIAVSMSDGSYAITARATDRAGNPPAASSGSLAVTVDTLAPAAPSTPDLAPGSDTGAQDYDNITNAASLTFTGTAEAGATVEILVGGNPRTPGDVADGSGDYSVTLDMSSHSGDLAISARATDAAGNGPVPSGGSLPVRIDRTAPTVTGFTPSDSELLEDESGTLTLSFTYSEPMDTGVDPTISFNPGIGGRLSAGPSCAWAAHMLTATYTVQAGGKDPAEGVVVTIQGARDVAGNEQQSYSSSSSAFRVSRSAASGDAARAASLEPGRAPVLPPAQRRRPVAVPESPRSVVPQERGTRLAPAPKTPASQPPAPRPARAEPAAAALAPPAPTEPVVTAAVSRPAPYLEPAPAPMPAGEPARAPSEPLLDVPAPRQEPRTAGAGALAALGVLAALGAAACALLARRTVRPGRERR